MADAVDIERIERVRLRLDRSSPRRRMRPRISVPALDSSRRTAPAPFDELFDIPCPCWGTSYRGTTKEGVRKISYRIVKARPSEPG